MEQHKKRLLEYIERDDGAEKEEERERNLQRAMIKFR